jgi:hypothetical protein
MRWIAIGSAILIISGIAVSRNEFALSPRVPNIANVPGNQAPCQTCHVNAGGGSQWNVFGEQVKANLDSGQPDWKKIFNLDADGDGFTNGQELGDPTGTWNPGSPNPTPSGGVTHPGMTASRPSDIQHRLSPKTWSVIKSLFK